MTREEELLLINQALSTPKYRRISSSEYLNHFFSNLNKSSEEARKRIFANKIRRIGTRSSKSKFKEII